jgi:Aldehyde dehydrogenase family
VQTHPAVNCISFTGGDTGISISKKAGMVPIQVCLHPFNSLTSYLNSLLTPNLDASRASELHGMLNDRYLIACRWSWEARMPASCARCTHLVDSMPLLMHLVVKLVCFRWMMPRSFTPAHMPDNDAVQDADLDLAAKNIVKGGYSYSGQRCTAVKLVLAHEAIADKLVEKVCGSFDFACFRQD